MSGNKKNIKPIKDVEIRGTVFLKKAAATSKSEHTGVFLKTDKGDFALRKIGGNPFYDASLHQLEGQDITAIGVLDKKLLMAKEIKTTKQ